MEYGIIPKIDAYLSKQLNEIKVIKPLEAVSIVSKDKEELPIVSKKHVSKTEEIKDIKNPLNTSTFVEYTLTNLDFGYNNNSRDFYIKVIRGSVENQYPTDEMMKLKAFLLKTQEVNRVL